MSSKAPAIQSPEPRIMLAHFIHQIEARHISTPNHPPVMLHWDFKTGALVEYAWYAARSYEFFMCPDGPNSNRPCDALTEARFTPSDLEKIRRTHHFKAPSCLCAFLDGTAYTEARIGVVETLTQDRIRNQSILHGEYVAICARRRCGYFRE